MRRGARPNNGLSTIEGHPEVSFSYVHLRISLGADPDASEETPREPSFQLLLAKDRVQIAMRLPDSAPVVQRSASHLFNFMPTKVR